jgi:type II secretory pathway component PulF
VSAVLAELAERRLRIVELRQVAARTAGVAGEPQTTEGQRAHDEASRLERELRTLIAEGMPLEARAALADAAELITEWLEGYTTSPDLRARLEGRTIEFISTALLNIGRRR